MRDGFTLHIERFSDAGTEFIYLTRSRERDTLDCAMKLYNEGMQSGGSRGRILMCSLDLNTALRIEAERRLRMLGPLADGTPSNAEIRHRAKETRIPADILRLWSNAYRAHRLDGLLPTDWQPLDEETAVIVCLRRKQLGDVVDLDVISEDEIVQLAHSNDWSVPLTKRWVFRYRVRGLWGLGPHRNAVRRGVAEERQRRVRDLGSLNEDDLEIIYRRKELLGDLVALPSSSVSAVGARVAELRTQGEQISERSLWDYLSRYRQHGWAGLAPLERADKGKYHNLTDRMVELVRGIRLSHPDLPAREVHSLVCQKARALSEPEPTEYQVRSICAAISEPVKQVADGRRDDFRNRYRFTYGMTFDGTVFQIDHTQVDVLVRDLRVERYRAQSGEVRPWLTTCIDSQSRALVGAKFGYDRPDRFTVAAVIRDSLLPSDQKPGGIPDEIWVDRGKELLSRHVQELSREMGIRLQPCAPHQPQLKGRVERFFGVLNTRLWSAEPGYVSSNTKDRNPSARAELTLAELEAKFWQFIEQYHHEPHSETGQTPVDYWNEKIFAIPADPRQLDILLMEPTARKVLKTGISYKGRIYWHVDLASLVNDSVLIRAPLPYSTPDEIEVFARGRWICTAFAVDSDRGRAIGRVEIREAIERQREGIQREIEESRRAVVDADLEISASQPRLEPAPIELQPAPEQPTKASARSNAPRSAKKSDLLDRM